MARPYLSRVDRYCPCGCLKVLTGRQRAALVSCRMRLYRRRRAQVKEIA
jgi:hypothetical protein